MRRYRGFLRLVHVSPTPRPRVGGCEVGRQSYTQGHHPESALRPATGDRRTSGIWTLGTGVHGTAPDREPLGCPDQRRRGRRHVARTKRSPVSVQDRKVIGGLLRDIRRSAGYRSVESASATKGCPASRQTIYAYERGGLVPSLPQFLELVEFFVLGCADPRCAGGEARRGPPSARRVGGHASADALRVPRDARRWIWSLGCSPIGEGRHERAHGDRPRGHRRRRPGGGGRALPADARREADPPRTRRRPRRRGGVVRGRRLLHPTARRARRPTRRSAGSSRRTGRASITSRIA